MFTQSGLRAAHQARHPRPGVCACVLPGWASMLYSYRTDVQVSPGTLLSFVRGQQVAHCHIPTQRRPTPVRATEDSLDRSYDVSSPEPRVGTRPGRIEGQPGHNFVEPGMELDQPTHGVTVIPDFLIGN